jgi:hypothetical protein
MGSQPFQGLPNTILFMDCSYEVSEHV